MVEKDKSFERFIEEEMAKTPEQIQKELMQEPGYPKLTPKPESYEKLKKRIQAYEASKTNENEKIEKVQYEDRVFMQLSEEDQEALRLGRELMAKRKAGEEKEEKKVVVYRKRKSHRIHRKAVVAAAATLVMTMGVSISSVGGPKLVLETMNEMFEERSRTTVDTDTGENTLVITENEEESAYQQIKDELGFEPVRMRYVPKNVVFQEMELDKESQDIYIYYESDSGYIVYLIQKQYTDGKNILDIEDKLVSESQIENDGEKIRIAEYKIAKSNTTKYFAEFVHDNTWYCIMGVKEKNEIEKIVKNLNFS